MSELFENVDDEKEEKAPLIVNSTEPIEEKAKKKAKKPRKPMTEERRKMLISNLQRGRETAKLNRQKSALAKKILKNKKKTDVEKVIEADIFEKSNRRNLEDEIKELKESIKELKGGKKLKEIPEDEKEEITKLKEEIKKLNENKTKTSEPAIKQDIQPTQKPTIEEQPNQTEEELEKKLEMPAFQQTPILNVYSTNPQSFWSKL